MKKSEREKLEAEAKFSLLMLVKPGDTVYTELLNVSRSGMYRRISAYVVKDGEMIKLDRLAIRLGVGDSPRNGNAGIGVGGCGMDMGFSIVYNLSRVLFGGGVNAHVDGGYALKHRWA